MTTQEVADQLVNYCRQGQYNEAQSELYSENAVSVEPEGSQWGKAEGLDAIKAKAEQWGSMVEEVHSVTVSDPLVAANFFSVRMSNDVTFKGMGRMTMEEICVYQVEDGKIVKEQFFFPNPPQE